VIRNPDFSEATLLPGEAAHWRFRSHVSGVQIAGFDPPPHLSAEAFERWFTFFPVLGAHIQAFWRPINADIEAFAAGWQIDAFLVAWPTGRSAQAVFEGEGIELFLWVNLRRVWSQISSRVGIVELFERAWRSDKIFTRCDLIPSIAANAFPETFDDAAWPPL
jgi:hypothetical protein